MGSSTKEKIRGIPYDATSTLIAGETGCNAWKLIYKFVGNTWQFKVNVTKYYPCRSKLFET